MGRQINFYLIPGDIDALAMELLKAEPYIVLHSRSASASPREVGSLDVLEKGHPWLYFHLVRPPDKNSVVMREVPAQGYWTVDVLRSPVIEFTRCYFDGHILRRGRMYYDAKYYGEKGDLVSKSDNFLEWAKIIFSKTKKNLINTNSDYVGHGTRKWMEVSGSRIVQ